MTDELDLMSTTEVAEMTGIPAGTWRFWRHCDADAPRSVRIGRRVFYRRHEVLAWIERQFEVEEQKGATA